MEKIRSIFPNAMHVERSMMEMTGSFSVGKVEKRSTLNDVDLFKAFYKEVKGIEATEETEGIFKEVLDELLDKEREVDKELLKQ